MTSPRGPLTILFALVVTASACVPATPPDAPSARPLPAPAGHVIWRYQQTLRLPSDPNVYENVLSEVKPLADGGWVALQLQRPVRVLPRGQYGGPLVKRDWLVLRLDARGEVVAREHASEPLGIQRLAVFERDGVLVGQGQVVQNGQTHGLDLRTLDGLWTFDAACVPAADRCYTFRTNAAYGPTALEEREVRGLVRSRTFAHLGMDGANGAPLVYPERNLVLWDRPWPSRGQGIAPLDTAKPIDVPWLGRLREARYVLGAGPDRVMVVSGSSEESLSSELTELSTGRVIARYGDEHWAGLSIGPWGAYLSADDATQFVDPRDGSFGPVLPAAPLTVALDRGIVVVPLGNGGAAVLRRESGRSQERSLAYTKIAEGACAEIDTSRVQLVDARLTCRAFAPYAGAGRVLVSTGKAPQVEDFAVSGVWADEATRRVTIRYRMGAVRSTLAGHAAPAQVIELPDLHGSWLVGLQAEGRSAFGGNTAWAIELP